MEYLYRNAAGEERTIVAGMKDAPPEVVVFIDDPKRPGYRKAIAEEQHADVFRRVILNGRGSGNAYG